MPRIEIEYPEDLQLAGLEETERNGRVTWRAYLRVRGKLYLQGMLGATPQSAVDNAIRAIREGMALNKEQAQYEVEPSGRVAVTTQTMEDLGL